MGSEGEPRKAKKGTVRVVADLPIEVFNAMELLSIRKGVTRAEALRHAISIDYNLERRASSEPLPEHPTNMDVIKERNKLLKAN